MHADEVTEKFVNEGVVTSFIDTQLIGIREFRNAAMI
jgi:hypothetical protein